MARPEQVGHGWIHGRLVKLNWPRMSEEDRQFALAKGYSRDTVAKAVMVSRMGDVGLTKNLDAEFGYDIRFEPPMILVSMASSDDEFVVRYNAARPTREHLRIVKVDDAFWIEVP